MSARVDLDPERESDFRERWDAGEPAYAMAAALGIGKNTVFALADRLDLPRRKRGGNPPTTKPKPEEDALLLRMWNEGASNFEIAEALGVTETTISRRARRLDLPRRMRPEARQAENNADDILRLHHEGLTPTVIGQRLGLTVFQVAGVLTRRDIEAHRGTPGRPKRSGIAMPMSAHDRERADASMVLTRCGTCGAHTLGTLLDGREWHRLHPCGQVPVEPAPPPPEVERHERHERQAVRRHVTVEGATVFA